jgi:putative membrane protein
MKKVPFLFLLALGAFTFQACDNSSKKKDSTEVAEDANEKTENVAEDDAEFVVKAASGGMTEVQLGKMAQEKGQSQRVKDFGAMMVKDHSKANDELKAIAGRKGIALPPTPGEDHQKHIDELAKLSGAEFDKRYVEYMEKDHDEDVKEFKKAADDCKDADLKTFAAKTLPTIQEHHDMVKSIRDSMKQ